MSTWLVVVLAVAVVVMAGGGLVARRHRASGAAATDSRDSSSAPMTGLEAALDRIADSNGRSMRSEIDAVADRVEQLRRPDDSGPLLRRALDQVTDDRGDARSDSPSDAPRDAPGTDA